MNSDANVVASDPAIRRCMRAATSGPHCCRNVARSQLLTPQLVPYPRRNFNADPSSAPYE